MSLRIAPPSAHPTNTSNTSSSSSATGAATSKPSVQPKGAPSAPGLPDTLRSSLTTATTSSSEPTSSTNPTTSSTHPLEARLTAWTQTQDSLRLETLRRTYGIAEPVRRGMELKIVREGEWRPAVFGGGVPSLHEDILSGRDAEISWEDVYTDPARVVGGDAGTGVHDEMERGVGMGKW